MRKQSTDAIVAARARDGLFRSAEDIALRVPFLHRKELKLLARIPGSRNDKQEAHHLFLPFSLPIVHPCVDLEESPQRISVRVYVTLTKAICFSSLSCIFRTENHATRHHRNNPRGKISRHSKSVT